MSSSKTSLSTNHDPSASSLSSSCSSCYRCRQFVYCRMQIVFLMLLCLLDSGCCWILVTETSAPPRQRGASATTSGRIHTTRQEGTTTTTTLFGSQTKEVVVVNGSDQQQQPSSSSSTDLQNQRDTDLIRQIGGSKADGYGELTKRGLYKWLSMYNNNNNPMIHGIENDRQEETEHTFLDLGSGTGSLVIEAAAIEQQLPNVLGFTSSIGIELSTERHSQALELLETSKDRGIVLSSNQIEFICGDMTDPEIARPLLERASVVWCNNLLFDNRLNHQIASLLSEFGQDSIQMIGTASKFPIPLKGYTLQPNELWLEMSWTPIHPCNIYLRDDKKELN